METKAETIERVYNELYGDRLPHIITKGPKSDFRALKMTKALEASLKSVWIPYQRASVALSLNPTRETWEAHRAAAIALLDYQDTNDVWMTAPQATGIGMW